ncbi:MAG: hypothetical protein HYX32_07350 [Actinobacteria bacterium]|nr:hypothetical protein [Actinomycetota bacterium]
MPSAVLAGGVLSGHPGRDYHVRRLLDTLDIAPVDEALAHAAGFLRTQTLHPTTDTPPSGVDAIVVAHADTTATHDDVMIVTSDEDDITALAIHTTNTSRLTVRLV